MKESQFIRCGADDDDAGPPYGLDGSPSRRKEQRGGKEKKWSMGKGSGGRVHPSPSHTELEGEKKKKAIVADKRAIQLRIPRTKLSKTVLRFSQIPEERRSGR